MRFGLQLVQFGPGKMVKKAFTETATSRSCADGKSL